ncbi:MAG: type IV pilin protein [Syntrophobacteraceae bacterium]
MRAKSKNCLLSGTRGYTLVELMVVVSILAILASVAVPAYINYVNRSKQSEAAGTLLTARLEMEEFYTDNRRYPSTIQCLPSFVANANTSCLSNCAACPADGAVRKLRYYTFYVAPPVGTNPLYYQIAATRKIYAWAATDNLTISANTDTPTVTNTSALGFSVFKWLFQ